MHAINRGFSSPVATSALRERITEARLDFDAEAEHRTIQWDHSIRFLFPSSLSLSPSLAGSELPASLTDDQLSSRSKAFDGRVSDNDRSLHDLTEERLSA